MSWVKDLVKDSVINSILQAIHTSNPQFYVFLDMANEVPVLDAWQHYQDEIKKLNLPPSKPIDWIGYVNMAAKFPITSVIVKFLSREYGITNISSMDVQELLDSFTKLGSDGK